MTSFFRSGLLRSEKNFLLAFFQDGGQVGRCRSQVAPKDFLIEGVKMLYGKSVTSGSTRPTGRSRHVSRRPVETAVRSRPG